jgi:Protein of unknown function (DUF2630)
MDEKTILAGISGLVDEEHRLRSAALAGQISSDEERARLRDIEEHLDQCWDLLRRRRAAQANHQDPDEVQERSVAVVEGYVQ